jgi:hypothetical protein
MSWCGTHYSTESERALSKLEFSHCRLCHYKARLQFDHKMFSDHKCGRCGLLFPASQINELKWFHDIRQIGNVYKEVK